jgi:hypothetical protein
VILKRKPVTQAHNDSIAQTKPNAKERSMEIEVHVGTIESSSGGIVQDSRRPVTFVGEELATFTEYSCGRGGSITDTRGVTETLYKAEDGRLVVHVDDWSRWLTMDDDGSRPAAEVAEELGCSVGYVKNLRRDDRHDRRAEG